MPNDVEAELKKVEAQSKGEHEPLPRDPNLTGGERSETPVEKATRKKRRQKPRQPPIIERTP